MSVQSGRMYVVYLYCILFGTTGKPSLVYKVSRDECVSMRWGDLCPTERKLQVIQASSQNQLNIELVHLRNEIKDLERTEISTMDQDGLYEALADMKNETRHFTIQVSDIQSMVVETTSTVSRIEDFNHSIDDMMRRVMGRLATMENQCSKDDELENHEIDSLEPCRIPVLSGRDCSEIHKKGGRTSGIYFIQPSTLRKPLQVYCDMQDRGGGWTVIQRRFDGSVDFDQDWDTYKEGFGDLSCEQHGEYWLGNEAIHLLTRARATELKVELTSWDGVERYAWYSYFRVDNEANGYALSHINGFRKDGNGNIGDAFSGSGKFCKNSSKVDGHLIEHKHMLFSTKDRDNDKHDGNCAANGRGGWWYNQCVSVNLNGKRRDQGGHAHLIDGDTDGMVWVTWRGCWESLKKSSMKIRPFGFMSTNSPITQLKAEINRKQSHVRRGKNIRRAWRRPIET